MFKKLLLTTSLSLCAAPVLAQNVLCPNRPNGDNSNACANTAFVQGAAGGAIPYNNITSVPANTFLGNNTGSPANIIALTPTQATAALNAFTTALQGLAPASGGGTTNFLRADGTWVAPAGGSGAANPTASIGLTPVNGVAGSFIRSDGAPQLSQAIAPTWTGTHIFSNATLAAQFGPNAIVGINNGGTTPTVPLQVGDVAPTSTGANITSARTSTGTVAVHGFAENSTLALTAAGQGMDSYDARMTVTGTQTYDHLVSYQARAQYGSSGLMTNMYGFFDGPGVNGPVTNQYGYYAANPAGSGTPAVGTAFFAEAQSKATLNYSFFTPFAGVFNAASLALMTLGKSGNDYPGIGYNVLFGSSAGVYKYASSDFAPFMRFGPSGQIQTFTSASGTAGNTITLNAGPFLAVSGTNWTASSDIRLKENIQPIDVLSRLDSYRAVSFDWKENGKHDVGVIAQEVEHSFPELVVHDNPDRLGVTYAPLGAMALEGVKELMQQVKILQAEVAKLKAKERHVRSN